MRGGSGTLVLVDGTAYPSIFKAAVEIGCNYSWLWCRLRAGRAVTIKGRRVALIKAAARGKPDGAEGIPAGRLAEALADFPPETPVRIHGLPLRRVEAEKSEPGGDYVALC